MIRTAGLGVEHETDTNPFKVLFWKDVVVYFKLTRKLSCSPFPQLLFHVRETKGRNYGLK